MKKTTRLVAALGAFFVIAISVAACGGSGSVGSNDVANVAGNSISKQAFNHWMYVAEKGNSTQGGGPVIVPTDPPSFAGCVKQVRAQIPTLKSQPDKTIKSDCKLLFNQLNSQVLDFLIKAYWYQASASKQGITVSKKELNTAFKQAQKQTFPTSAAYKSFLTETGETRADIDWRLRVNSIFSKLVKKQSPAVNAAAIQKYYAAHASQFGTPPTRDVELIQNTSKAKIQSAEAALKSGQSWASVAKQYSTNAASKSSGGVIKNVQNGTGASLEAAVTKVVFAAPLNKLQGPVKGSFGYYLVEATKATKGTTVSLKKASPEIKEILTDQDQQSAQTKIDKAAKKQWGATTKCATAYMMDDCAGYKAPKTTSTPAAATPTTGATGATGAAGAAAGTATATTPASTGTSTTK